MYQDMCTPVMGVFAIYLSTLTYCSCVKITYGARCFPLLCPDKWALTSLFASLIEVAGIFLLNRPEGSDKPYDLPSSRDYNI